jgi:hypothetical protein
MSIGLFLFVIITVILTVIASIIIVKKNIYIPTFSGAIAVAFGIMINGAFQQDYFLKRLIGPYAVYLLVSLLIIIVLSNLNELRSKKYYLNHHFSDEIHTFAAGTYVIAFFTVTLSIVKELRNILILAYVLFIAGCIIYLLYLFISVKNYKAIWQENYSKKILMYNLNGVILLVSVATSYVVIDGSLLIGKFFIGSADYVLLILSSLFYIAGLYMIIRNYIKYKYKIIDNWKLGNVIIHGALSTFGLACIIAGFSSNITGFIWIAALILFIVVEIYEVVFLIKRIQYFGVNKGVLVYSTNQWARNFTFGMFLAFSIMFKIKDSVYYKINPLDFIYNLIFSYGKYIVIVFFIVELIIFAHYNINKLNKLKIYDGVD